MSQSDTEVTTEDETTGTETIPEGDLSYVLGNKHNPVIVLGDDPANTEEDIRGDDGAVIRKKQDNVLVAHFVRVESVPRESVYAEEQANTDA